MREDKIIVMIHIDALRHDYINSQDTPFLSSLAQDGIFGHIIPPFAFEPDGAYLAGLTPEEYEGGTHFIYSPETSPFQFTEYIRFFDYTSIYIQHPIRKVIEAVVQRQTSYHRIKMCPMVIQIPLNILRYFDYCYVYFPFEGKYLDGRPTIFNLLDRTSKQWHYHGVPQFRCDVRSVKEWIPQIPDGLDFLFLMITDPDRIGHKYCPESPQRHEIMKAVDEILQELFKLLDDRNDTVETIVFGDHGMVEIKKLLDIESMLRETKLRVRRDYLYFLDSTLARFWFFNDRAERIITELFGSLQNGSIITDQEKEEYKIRFKDRKFGDFIYWVDGGTLIFPNFWHRRRPKKGMHGYRKEVLDNHAAFIFHSNRKMYGLRRTQPLAMQDVFATTIEALGLKMPTGAKGKAVQSYGSETGLEEQTGNV